MASGQDRPKPEPDFDRIGEVEVLQRAKRIDGSRSRHRQSGEAQLAAEPDDGENGIGTRGLVHGRRSNFGDRVDDCHENRSLFLMEPLEIVGILQHAAHRRFEHIPIDRGAA